MKFIAWSCFVTCFLISQAGATPTIRQMGSAQSPDYGCNQYLPLTSPEVCTAPPSVDLTVSLTPVPAGDAVGVFIEAAVILPPICTDSLGQQWTESPSGPWYYPTGQTAGISSVTCHFVFQQYPPGTGTGHAGYAQIQVFDITWAQLTSSQTFTSLNQQFSCGAIGSGALDLLFVGATPSYVQEGGSNPGFPPFNVTGVNVTAALTTVVLHSGYEQDDGAGKPYYANQMNFLESFYGLGGTQGLSSSLQWSGDMGSGGLPGCYDLEFQSIDVSADLGSSSPPSGCEGTCGLPINLRTGNTYIGQQDYSLPGLSGGLGLTRTWNSMWPLSSPVNEVVVRQNRVGPRNQQLPQFPQPIRLL